LLGAPSNPWLHRYAVFTALATLALIGIGGLVTSRGVGMAVPDWPNSFGYNMFLFPPSKWVGGIFYEHTHRLVASVVGLLVVGLTRWLGGWRSRLPMALIGLLEVIAGLVLLRLGPDWNGAGHFLSGIGGVVLLVAAIWARNEPAQRPLPQLGWLAFGAVQLQGLLGGLRVVLSTDEIGFLHALLAQLFFVLVCVIALFTSAWWQRKGQRSEVRDQRSDGRALGGLRWLVGGTTLLILAQLVLGAAMRHQHAGLAIPDFPLAYGKIWPETHKAAVERYNRDRMEITAVKPITASQIQLQMAHRLVAIAILAAVGIVLWRNRGKRYLNRLGLVWFGLIAAQALLGAATIWSDKAADVATAHVLLGALSLAVGAILSIISFGELAVKREDSRTAEVALPCPAFETGVKS